ncbi:MAG: hypothetical protein HY900_20075 [Deltaproteobacteria bacterium]|nr:hypothetical protein [Deltaproteobacteria bacterium]
MVARELEYALRFEVPGEVPADPRSWCGPRWRRALPAGRLTAVYFGSEFCEERLPSAAEASCLCTFARDRGLEAVLLTPLVRPGGLARVDRLLAELATEGLAPAVVFNDWGVLRLLRERYPDLPPRGGRLLNRGLRDPRLAAEARPGYGAGERGRHLRELLRRLGATAVETDPDLDGGFLGEGGERLQRTLHLPYVFAASGRACLLKASAAADEGAFSRAFASGCAQPCRTGALPERRPDTPLPLLRAGNTLFYEAPEALAAGYLPHADRIVVHRRPAP